VLLLLSAGGLAVAGCGGGRGSGNVGGAGGSGNVGGSGGSGGAAVATCGTLQPCGGEVVGDWNFVEQCDSPASFAASAASFSMMAAQSWCPGQTLVGLEPQASGSLRLDAAGSYSLALVFGGYIVINFPAPCIAGVSCDDATAGFQAQIDEGTYPNPNVVSISCSGSSNCLCRAAVDVRRSDTGTYASSGSILTFTATGGGVTNKGYCVVGNALHLLDTSMGSTGQTNVDSDLVAMKQ
jgi:hypothetical protein